MSRDDAVEALEWLLKLYVDKVGKTPPRAEVLDAKAALASIKKDFADLKEQHRLREDR